MRWMSLAMTAVILGAGQSQAADKAIAFAVHSVHSGNWSEVATWREHRLPAAGENVQITPGTAVTYDLANGPAFRAIHVAGTLRISREHSTVLSAGLIKITPGEACSEDGFVCDAHAAPPVVAGGGGDGKTGAGDRHGGGSDPGWHQGDDPPRLL